MTEEPTVRRTKIVCTVGPATFSPERIRAMILAGMNVARLNFSHGDHDSHFKTLQRIRDISDGLGRVVGILQDLAGPKIRLGILPVEERVLRAGERIALSPVEGDDPAGIRYTERARQTSWLPAVLAMRPQAREIKPCVRPLRSHCYCY